MIRIFTTLCFSLSGLVTTAHADLSDCGVSDVVEIANDTFVAGEDITCSASTRITFGPNVTVDDGARLYLTAPLVELTPTIQIFNGAIFLANTGATPKATGKLNDTGITTCKYRSGITGFDCPLVDYPGQDAEYGRDVTHNDDSDGHAGFSFTKLDVNGYPLPAGATDWSCVKDNVTGLVWEVKTNDDGLRDRDYTYSWYNPDSSINGGSAGTQDGGSCTGSRCDTQEYVQAVNSQGLCGANDWRMPTINELENIVSRNRCEPPIDTFYFPNTRYSSYSFYWSGSPYAYDSNDAWNIRSSSGHSNRYSKGDNGYVRLVRGGQISATDQTRALGDTQSCNDHIPSSTPDNRFTVNGDEVVDKVTGLIWQRCTLGQTGSDCNGGSANTYMWQGVLQAAEAERTATGESWRLPNINELRSIVEERCYTPSINLSVFPNTMKATYWSGSPSVFYYQPWYVVFSYGYMPYINTNPAYVRLVRGGQ